MDYAKESLRLHGEWRGKIEIQTRVPVETKDDLSLAYTPGVAQPCLEIRRDPDKSYTLTRRHNLCAVMLQKMLRLPDADATDVFAESTDDSAVAAWALPSSAALEAVGIDLRPLAGESVTRRECAELLYQLSTLCQQDILQEFYHAE